MGLQSQYKGWELREDTTVPTCPWVLFPLPDQRKNKFMKKIPKDSEASNVLVGEVDFLDQPFIAFVRLIQSAMLGGMTEVPVPTRCGHGRPRPTPALRGQTPCSQHMVLLGHPQSAEAELGNCWRERDLLTRAEF